MGQSCGDPHVDPWLLFPHGSECHFTTTRTRDPCGSPHGDPHATFHKRVQCYAQIPSVRVFRQGALGIQIQVEGENNVVYDGNAKPKVSECGQANHIL